MNKNKQLPSGIDYFEFFMQTPNGDEYFTKLSEDFWNMTRNTTKETYARHTLYRMLWLGDWLTERNDWKKINPALSPQNGLLCIT